MSSPAPRTVYAPSAYDAAPATRTAPMSALACPAGIESEVIVMFETRAVVRSAGVWLVTATPT